MKCGRGEEAPEAEEEGTGGLPPGFPLPKKAAASIKGVPSGTETLVWNRLASAVTYDAVFRLDGCGVCLFAEDLSCTHGGESQPSHRADKKSVGSTV